MKGKSCKPGTVLSKLLSKDKVRTEGPPRKYGRIFFFSSRNLLLSPLRFIKYIFNIFLNERLFFFFSRDMHNGVGYSIINIMMYISAQSCLLISIFLFDQINILWYVPLCYIFRHCYFLFQFYRHQTTNIST